MRKTSPLMKACDIVLESVAIALVGMLATTWCGQVFAAESLRHPMDPLTARDYAAVITALKKDNYVDNSSRYSLITLDEPAKAKVLKWKPGDAVPSQAFVIVKKGPQTFEAVVDITRGKVVSWKQVKRDQGTGSDKRSRLRGPVP